MNTYRSERFKEGADMTIPIPTSSLGVIIKNAKARALIYGIYVLAIIAAGGCQVAFSSLELAQPDWLIAVLAVLLYLGAPVGTLAVANTGRTD